MIIEYLCRNEEVLLAVTVDQFLFRQIGKFAFEIISANCGLSVVSSCLVCGYGSAVSLAYPAAMNDWNWNHHFAPVTQNCKLFSIDSLIWDRQWIGVGTYLQIIPYRSAGILIWIGWHKYDGTETNHLENGPDIQTISYERRSEILFGYI